jgi:hypothetical protein
MEQKYGWITVHKKSLPGGYSYVTLTKKGCDVIGVSQKYAEPLTDDQQERAIARVYFCFLDGMRRDAASEADVTEWLGGEPPTVNVHYVVSTELGHPCLFRIVRLSSMNGLCNRIRKVWQESQAHAETKRWMSQSDYGLALLCERTDLSIGVRRRIQIARMFDTMPLIVGVGPSSTTLPEEMRRRKV